MKRQSCRLLDLPSPILMDILSRLPPNEIIRGRCTCKIWNDSVSDPQFLTFQSSRTPTYVLVNNLKSSPSDSSCFSLIDFEDVPDRRHRLVKIAGTKLQLLKTTADAEMNIVGIINGFVCICEFTLPRHVIYIWNPILGEFITFQAPVSNTSVASYGFGLSSEKGQYKVVRICQEWKKDDSLVKSECHVYTLGTGAWKRIEIEKIQYFCKGNAAFIHGNLHWLIEYGSNFLYYLDLEKETVESFPSPPLDQFDLEYFRATLNLYTGNLCICDNTEEFDAKVWVMEEYGAAKSWIKLYVITEDPLGLLGNYFNTVHFVYTFGDGEILILLGNNVMILRHPDGRTWDVDTHDLVTNCVARDFATIEALQFHPSFMSLENLGEEVFKVM